MACRQSHVLGSVRSCFTAAAALLVAGPSWAQDECDEVFTYSSCTYYERIVLDSYGPDGPITADLQDVLRASIDMGLIWQAIPQSGIGHSPSWNSTAILYQTLTPDDPDLICTNIYYKAEVSGPGEDGWYYAQFPVAVNVFAMMEAYVALPAVQAATLDLPLGCTDHCCFPNSQFEKLPDDTWRWTLFVPCFLSNTWCVDVSATGEVTWCLPGDISPPGGDGVVGPDDLAFLLAYWGTCTCVADLSLPIDGQVGPADLAELLANWS